MKAYSVWNPTIQGDRKEILVIARDIVQAAELCPISKSIRELGYKVVLVGNEGNES